MDPVRSEISFREHAAVLSEIHHRVKNNLHVLMSLLALQAERTTQAPVIELLGEMRNRIRVVANLHEPLYSLDNFSAVHFGEYLNNLARELEGFYRMGARVQLQLSLADLALDTDDALALALISNELVSNAFKHAFRDRRSGKISIALRYADSGTQTKEVQFGELSVIDDGIGLPQEFDFAAAGTMGFYLIRILTRQLKGTVEVETHGGTSIRICFPLTKEPLETGPQLF